MEPGLGSKTKGRLSAGAATGIAGACVAFLLLGVVVLGRRREHQDGVPMPQKRHQSFGQAFGPFGQEFSKPKDSFPAYRGATPIAYDDVGNEFESPTKMSPKALPGPFITSPVGSDTGERADGRGLGAWGLDLAQETETDLEHVNAYIHSNISSVENTVFDNEPKETDHVQVKIHSPVKITTRTEEATAARKPTQRRFSKAIQDLPANVREAVQRKLGENETSSPPTRAKTVRRSPEIFVKKPTMQTQARTTTLRRSVQSNSSLLDDAMNMLDVALKAGCSPEGATSAAQQRSSPGSIETTIDNVSPEIRRTKTNRRFSMLTEQLPTPSRENVQNKMAQLPTPIGMKSVHRKASKSSLQSTSPSSSSSPSGSPGTRAAIRLMNLGRSPTAGEVIVAAEDPGVFYSPVRSEPAAIVNKAKGFKNMNVWVENDVEEPQVTLQGGYEEERTNRLIERLTVGDASTFNSADQRLSIVLDDESGNGGSMFTKRGASTFSLV